MNRTTQMTKKLSTKTATLAVVASLIPLTIISSASAMSLAAKNGNMAREFIEGLQDVVTVDSRRTFQRGNPTYRSRRPSRCVTPHIAISSILASKGYFHIKLLQNGLTQVYKAQKNGSWWTVYINRCSGIIKKAIKGPRA